MLRSTVGKYTRPALLAGAVLGLSACTYGGLGVGASSGGYINGYSNYDCDPYAPFDDYYACDDGYGFANIGFGGGWYDHYYYPGYGRYIFDRKGRRHAMKNNHRRYWAHRRAQHGVRHARRGGRGLTPAQRAERRAERRERRRDLTPEQRAERRERRTERRRGLTPEQRAERRERRAERRAERGDNGTRNQRRNGAQRREGTTRQRAAVPEPRGNRAERRGNRGRDVNRNRSNPNRAARRARPAASANQANARRSRNVAPARVSRPPAPSIRPQLRVSPRSTRTINRNSNDE